MKRWSLRLGALAMNVVVFYGVPWLLGAPHALAALTCVVGFAWSAAVAWQAPEGDPADAMTTSLAHRLAERMQLPHARFVRRMPGWGAGAVRVSGGYGLVVGEEVAPDHREAVLAHELAHVALGDLDWEPWTDGVARALSPAVRKVPPILLTVFPFFLFGAPLARWTEYWADDFAACHVSSYPSVIQEVATALGARETLLYPSLEARARRSARRSLRIER